MLRIFSLLALVLVTACSQNGFGNGGLFGGGNSAGTTPPVVDPNAPPQLDPTSPAFFSQNVGDRVLFDVDQFVLNDGGKATLDAQSAWLLANPSYQVVIEGHADEQGTREYNLALGARRARSVQEYLLSKGIPANRLRTLSFGKERPIEICSEEACYAKNRRAVTVLAGGIS